MAHYDAICQTTPSNLKLSSKFNRKSFFSRAIITNHFNGASETVFINGAITFCRHRILLPLINKAPLSARNFVSIYLGKVFHRALVLVSNSAIHPSFIPNCKWSNHLPTVQIKRNCKFLHLSPTLTGTLLSHSYFSPLLWVHLRWSIEFGDHSLKRVSNFAKLGIDDWQCKSSGSNKI